MSDNPFIESEEERDKIVDKQEREINKLYRDAAKYIERSIKRLSGSNTEYAALRRAYLMNLRDEVKNQITDIDSKTETIISSNVDRMVYDVIKTNSIYMNNVGFNNMTVNPQIRIQMANRIINGELYNGKYTLSSAIWGDNKQKLNEVNNIVAQGILKGQDVYFIAKSLQSYVNPNAKKMWNWSSVYPGSRRKIDYNAQRLARTMVQHAYQETFVKMTINNPFISAYRWITSGSDVVCNLCMDRESTDNYGLGKGIYPKDALPLDHPNGMCTFDIVTPYTDKEVADAIADWYLGEGDKSMNKQIDKYVKSLK